MPQEKSNLRDLAAKIEAIAVSHPAFSQAYPAVHVCVDHLCAVARVSEINQDDARPLQVLTFMYINYENKVAERQVNPLSIRWGTSEWYKEPQWLLMCWDLDKADRREFAIARMILVKQQDRPAGDKIG